MHHVTGMATFSGGRDRSRRQIATEPRREAFRTLCDSFMRKTATAILHPAQRRDSDPILLALIRSELGSYGPDIGAMALDAALRAAETATLAASQTGALGHGTGGAHRLVAYLERVLRTKAADIQRAEAARRAKLATEQAVHTAIAEKRLRGAVAGGARRRSSWSDIFN